MHVQATKSHPPYLISIHNTIKEHYTKHKRRLYHKNYSGTAISSTHTKLCKILKICQILTYISYEPQKQKDLIFNNLNSRAEHNRGKQK